MSGDFMVAFASVFRRTSVCARIGQELKMALERTYPFTDSTLRETMHRFVDDVLEALTGERGVAETKIAYVRQDG
ncbi:MAG TPA: hypothetical protein VN972_04920, partial [Methylomirabilota bacterium]|nr:hypothetical protein [Methylomirabilota bacterium]